MNRGLIIRIIIIAIGLLFAGRLLQLQLFDERYKLGANANAIRKMTEFPPRGEIFDRNGKYLAQSIESYDIMVVPIDVKKFDTTHLASILEVTPEQLITSLDKAKKTSYRRPSVLFKQMPPRIKMRFEEYIFHGFYTQYRTLRHYPYNTCGNILGYVSEVSQSIIDSNPYYKIGDYHGMTGLERAYEEDLRGVKGTKLELVDVHGVPQGAYMGGSLDTAVVTGTSIVSTIDIELQKLGEELMAGKRGSIVAIEPQTGEILMMVSSPTYNPSDLVGRDRSKNFSSLVLDQTKPMFNRAVMAYYPPGSTFKMAGALIGLQEGLITKNYRYNCHNGYHYGNRVLKCHSHAPSTDLHYSIQTSCNGYYCDVYRMILENRRYGKVDSALTVWRNHLLTMGFGQKLNSDFLGELNGNIPTAAFYNKIYNGRWNAYTVLSNSIGQGEVLVTPLQLANFICSIANKGHFYTPHIVKQIGGDGKLPDRFYQKNYTSVESRHYEDVVEGMWRAANVSGTAMAARIEGMDVCGKTGTAENSGKDHSTFAAFAPRNNPKIAISVYVENGGFGATIALPIAKLIMEKYLLGEVKSTALEQRMKETVVYYKQI